MNPQKPTGIEAEVCEDIARRQRTGMNKYGMTVADNPLDLRQWLTHAYEESLDQAVYLKRAIREIDDPTHKDSLQVAPEAREQREWDISANAYKGFPDLADGPELQLGEKVRVREVLPTPEPSQVAEEWRELGLDDPIADFINGLRGYVLSGGVDERHLEPVKSAIEALTGSAKG